MDHVTPHLPVRQCVRSLSISPRLLLAVRPQRLTPVLQVVPRAVTRPLPGQAGHSATEADGGAVTPLQRFGSAAHPSIPLHWAALLLAPGRIAAQASSSR